MERRTNDCVLFSEQLVVWFSNFPSDLVELRNSSYLKISWLFYMSENNLIRTFVAKFYDKCIDVNSLIGTTNLNDRIRLEIEHHIWGANNFFCKLLISCHFAAPKIYHRSLWQHFSYTKLHKADLYFPNENNTNIHCAQFWMK